MTFWTPFYYISYVVQGTSLLAETVEKDAYYVGGTLVYFNVTIGTKMLLLTAVGCWLTRTERTSARCGMRPSSLVCAAFALCAVQQLACVHAGGGDGGFVEGLLHSVFGLDHLLAMVCVGVVIAQRGGANMVPMPRRLPWAEIYTCVALFGTCHGIAHGAEMPKAANPLFHSVGFVISTTILHVTAAIVERL